MSFYEQALQANLRYAEGFKHGDLPPPPARKAVVLTCMDARLMPDQFLGFGIGEVHVIRNAGALATDDAIRLLVISTHLLGTREILIVAHTSCGMLTFHDEDVQKQPSNSTGQTPAVLPCTLLPTYTRASASRFSACANAPSSQRISRYTGWFITWRRASWKRSHTGRF